MLDQEEALKTLWHTGTWYKCRQPLTSTADMESLYSWSFMTEFYLK